MSRDDKLISFYKQCVQKGYTNMADDTQSLKAKVIAMDLNLRYKTIESLFAEAKSTYEIRLAAEERVRQRKQEEQEKKNQQAIAERNRLATDGDWIMTVYSYLSGEKEGREVAFYRRPDKSIYYKENGGIKKEGQPTFTVENVSTVFYNYHEGKTVYTGATVGGITTGGFHTEAPYMSQHKQYTGKGEIIVSYDGKRFEAKRVRFPAIIAERFHRDSAYWSYVRGEDYLLVASSLQDNKDWKNLMRNFDSIGQYDRLEKFSNAKADTLYSKDTCREIVRFLDRVVRGDYPKSDKERFESVANIPEDACAATIKRVIDELSSISGYSPADALRRTLQSRYEKVLQQEKEAEVLRREKAQTKRKKVVPIVAVVAAVLLAAFLLVTQFIIPSNQYEKAIALAETGEDVQAFYILTDLGNFKDADAQIKKLVANAVHEETALFDRLEEIPLTYFSEDAALSYDCAIKLFNNGKREAAAEYFNFCKNYEDTASYLKYIAADTAANDSDWETAMAGFKAIGSFLDSDYRLDEARYNYVVSESEFPINEAITTLEQIKNKDSKVLDLLDMCKAVNACAGEFRCVSSTYRDDRGRALNLSLYSASFTFYLDCGTVMANPDYASYALDDACVKKDSTGKYAWHIKTRGSAHDFNFFVSETSAKLVTDIMLGLGDEVFLFTR